FHTCRASLAWMIVAMASRNPSVERFPILLPIQKSVNARGGIPFSRAFRFSGLLIPTCTQKPWLASSLVLLFREKIPSDWLPKVQADLPAVLVDHAHLERKAATSALNLEKYRDLYPRVQELNAIAIEELQHFQLVLDLLKKRGIPFGQPYPSPWI